MDFGVTKGAKLVVHTCRGNFVKSEGIKLPDGKPDQESGRGSQFSHWIKTKPHIHVGWSPKKSATLFRSHVLKRTFSSLKHGGHHKDH